MCIDTSKVLRETLIDIGVLNRLVDWTPPRVIATREPGGTLTAILTVGLMERGIRPSLKNYPSACPL